MNPSDSLPPLRCISSMATRQLLTRLARQYRQATGIEVALESVGGVDAARRLAAGEAFDVAVLASDAVAGLVASGHLAAGSEAVVALSGLAAAVAEGRPAPRTDTLAQLLRLLGEAGAIGYSTGPSGKALLERLRQWGVLEALQPRLVQAPPGQPVAAMVARGEVDIGFQQLSEMVHSPGIALLAELPPEARIVTAFTAAACVPSPRSDEACAFIRYLCGAQAAEAKQEEGMSPAPVGS
ncbi:extracellular solute-binding protein [Xylophilus rhododendri]|uniref:Extracellular solute-binding protein n=1 Tax=Xylophilus rhododendri TaxID=2697032 RepID=A0A857J483_9BURK|nr:substrate-binding domain-containing protein [Xylophilus rhododendri]QHI98467.1 extracellular solute-binding protein [Xylophilus rhododendri]